MPPVVYGVPFNPDRLKEHQDRSINPLEGRLTTLDSVRKVTEEAGFNVDPKLAEEISKLRERIDRRREQFDRLATNLRAVNDTPFTRLGNGSLGGDPVYETRPDLRDQIADRSLTKDDYLTACFPGLSALAEESVDEGGDSAANIGAANIEGTGIKETVADTTEGTGIVETFVGAAHEDPTHEDPIIAEVIPGDGVDTPIDDGTGVLEVGEVITGPTEIVLPTGDDDIMLAPPAPHEIIPIPELTAQIPALGPKPVEDIRTILINRDGYDIAVVESAERALHAANEAIGKIRVQVPALTPEEANGLVTAITQFENMSPAQQVARLTDYLMAYVPRDIYSCLSGEECDFLARLRKRIDGDNFDADSIMRGATADKLGTLLLKVAARSIGNTAHFHDLRPMEPWAGESLTSTADRVRGDVERSPLTIIAVVNYLMPLAGDRFNERTYEFLPVMREVIDHYDNSLHPALRATPSLLNEFQQRELQRLMATLKDIYDKSYREDGRHLAMTPKQVNFVHEILTTYHKYAETARVVAEELSRPATPEHTLAYLLEGGGFGTGPAALEAPSQNGDGVHPGE